MALSSILFDGHGTLRSGWRFLIFTVLVVFAGGPAAFAAYAALSFLFPEGPGIAVSLTVNSVVSAATALLAGWVCARYLEHLPFRSLGAAFTKGWLKNLVTGILLGGLTFAAASVIGLASGSLSFTLDPDADFSAILTTLVISFVIFFAAAAFEEALLRGYVLQTFVRSDLTLFAILFTSLIFATLHNANPGATWLSWLNTFLAGVWLAAAYLRTRDLWFPLGIHLAWNWVQGSVFGIEVSGLTEIIRSPVFREVDAGPAWVTGGDYGIEGGVVCTAAIVLSIAAIWFLPNLTPDPELAAMTSPPSPNVNDRLTD